VDSGVSNDEAVSRVSKDGKSKNGAVPVFHCDISFRLDQQTADFNAVIRIRRPMQHSPIPEEKTKQL
jgi:hypothetical protein